MSSMFGAFLSWTVSAANVVVNHTTSAIMFVRDFLVDQPVDGEIDQPTIVDGHKFISRLKWTKATMNQPLTKLHQLWREW